MGSGHRRSKGPIGSAAQAADQADSLADGPTMLQQGVRGFDVIATSA